MFFLLQIGTMIGWGADSLIISSTLGASSVAVFNISQKLFQFISQPLAIINAPLWAAYADAFERHEKEFIKGTLKKSLLFSFFCAVFFGAIVFIASGIIIHKWTSGSITINKDLVFLFYVWLTVDVVANAFSMFMNGCNIIKAQVYATISLVIFTLPLKFLALSCFGLKAMVAMFVAFFTMNLLFWYGFYFRTKIFSIFK